MGENHLDTLSICWLLLISGRGIVFYVFGGLVIVLWSVIGPAILALRLELVFLVFVPAPVLIVFLLWFGRVDLEVAADEGREKVRVE